MSSTYSKIISAARQLNEAFNKPLPTEVIPDDTMLHQMGEMSAAAIGGSNYKMFKIPKAGYIVQFDKDGATEVHHIDDSLQSGYKQSSGKSALGFASTLAHHVKSLLDQNKTVRISAHKDLAPNFKSITDHLIKRNPEYSVTEPKESEHEITGKPLVSWEIKKHLTEALASSAHKAMATKAANIYADSEGRTNAQQISKEVMPTDRITIPLERTSTPNKNVTAHLNSKGYHVDDYQQGIAYHESNPSRKFRIGRVLNQINAPQEIKTAYEKDPARQGINSTGASIVISRHPYDVAAMSTHQKWESCQTLGGKATVINKEGEKEVKQQDPGSYKEMVPGIVSSGAHIAYLVNHPSDIDKHYAPVARITLNAYKSQSGHTILRPSDEYGDHWEGFHSSVKNWAEKNFPAKDAIYLRHSDAYPEGENEIRNYSPEHNNVWKRFSDERTLREHPEQEVLQHHLNNMIETKQGNISALMSNPNLSEKDGDTLVYHFADHPRQHTEIAMHARTPNQIQTIMDKNRGMLTIARALSKNPNTTSDQLHEIIDSSALGQTSVPGVREFVHNGYSPEIMENIVKHPNSNDSHYHKMFELKGVHGDRFDRMSAFVDNWNTFENIAHKYNSEDVGKKLADLFENPVGNEIPHQIVHDIAMKHPHLVTNFPEDALYKGLENHPENMALQKIAMDRGTPNLLSSLARATKDRGLLDKLSQHPHEWVSRAANLRKIFLDTKQ